MIYMIHIYTPPPCFPAQAMADRSAAAWEVMRTPSESVVYGDGVKVEERVVSRVFS